MNLLTRDNYKTVKGEKFGYITYILYMSPHRDNSRGVNLCPFASRGCAAACLFGSGFGGMFEKVANSRRERSELFLSDRKLFLGKLDIEIGMLMRKHKGDRLVIRLNGTSDISYETYKVRDGKNIFELYPDIQFYDYTKNYLRFNRELPGNYHLTFSRSENNGAKADKLLELGYNVAVVFDVVPKRWRGYKVIDGDKSDLRFLDGKNVVVGLKYKKLTGKGVNNASVMDMGFVVKVSEKNLVN